MLTISISACACMSLILSVLLHCMNTFLGLFLHGFVNFSCNVSQRSQGDIVRLYKLVLYNSSQPICVKKKEKKKRKKEVCWHFSYNAIEPIILWNGVSFVNLSALQKFVFDVCVCMFLFYVLRRDWLCRLTWEKGLYIYIYEKSFEMWICLWLSLTVRRWPGVVDRMLKYNY